MPRMIARSTGTTSWFIASSKSRRAASPPPFVNSAASTAVPGDLAGARPPHIDAGEQEQPHDVDEVPVPGGEFEAEVLLRREMAGERPCQGDDQEKRGGCS